MIERLNSKKRQLILSFIGRAEVPSYPNGRLAGHIADLRGMGIVAARTLTPYGRLVAAALTDGRGIPRNPRRCETGLVDTMGECIACDADQGETCRTKKTADPTSPVSE